MSIEIREFLKPGLVMETEVRVVDTNLAPKAGEGIPKGTLITCEDGHLICVAAEHIHRNQMMTHSSFSGWTSYYAGDVDLEGTPLAYSPIGKCSCGRGFIRKSEGRLSIRTQHGWLPQ